eukprot:GHVP01021827.1.p1 GENE.GHVP01021827.1~~GHVP01021827.1.p1  ORF type:complete len:237 (-),score=4.11 GHVP01021827.1:281-991(-)
MSSISSNTHSQDFRRPPSQSNLFYSPLSVPSSTPDYYTPISVPSQIDYDYDYTTHLPLSNLLLTSTSQPPKLDAPTLNPVIEPTDLTNILGKISAFPDPTIETTVFGKKTPALLDTGASMCVLCKCFLPSPLSPTQHPSDLKFKTVSQSLSLPVLSIECKFATNHDEIACRVETAIVPCTGDHLALIGRNLLSHPKLQSWTNAFHWLPLDQLSLKYLNLPFRYQLLIYFHARYAIM